VNIAPAIPDATLVIVVGLPVSLAVRDIGGRRRGIGMQLMLMMIVQSMMMLMMPFVVVFRGGC